MNSLFPVQLFFGVVAFLFARLDATQAQETIHPSLLPPQHVMAGEMPIDIERSGHAAPFFGDIDGDGLMDLLVGEYFEGRVRVYKNIGVEGEPKFGEFEWIESEQGLAKVPSD